MPDEDELFGLSLGEFLKKMPMHQKALAIMKIQQIMYEMQCNSAPQNT